MFPHQLDDPQAFAIAQAIVEGFDRHYRLFSAAARGAKARFEKADWQGQLDAQRDRIAFYDLRVDEAVERLLRSLGDARLRANFQVQVLSSLFYRNKGAYVVGKIVNGFGELPFALPILHGDDGLLVIDTALIGEDDLLLLFSFARAYFM